MPKQQNKLRGNEAMETKSRILLVDDETRLLEELTPILERAGFQVITAADGKAALDQVATSAPDLIVLDVVMPHLDGREVLRHLRDQDNWTPVILLTQVGESFERAMALNEGADDYMNKPYDPHELIARIKAILRRTRRGLPSLAVTQRLISDDLVLDPVSHRAWLDGQELTLTPKAMFLLKYLMTHSDELLTRTQLLDAIWGWAYDEATGPRAVDARIHELRKELNDIPIKPHYIETVSGQGYRFIAEVRVEEPASGKGGKLGK
jgi:DNA-binding response OmpR family regulator